MSLYYNGLFRVLQRTALLKLPEMGRRLVVMKKVSFQNAAIKSAELYYNYLEKNGGGVIVYRVSQIIRDENSFHKNEYWLHLMQKPKNTDGLMVKIQNQVYTTEQIKPIEYNSYNQTLKVCLNESTKDIFDGCRPENVNVISDLKFLVRRVENWYKQFGDCIKRPAENQLVKPADCSMLTEIPSEDQVCAIQGVLSEPFTYVWGAPGTGKTKVVLTRSVLAYIREGKKVLVAAPTNNAVEQMLNGILPVLKDAGVDYDKKVIRLGMASAEFASKYPKICENSGYSKAISEINDNLSALRIAFEENRQLKCLYNEFEEFQLRRSAFLEKTKPLKTVMLGLAEMGTRFSSVQSVMEDVLLQIAQNEDRLEESKSSLEFYNKQAKSMLKRFHNPIYAIFRWFDKEAEQKKIDDVLEKVRYYEEKIRGIQSETDRLKEEIDRNKVVLTEIRASFEALVMDAVQCTAFCPELLSVVNAIQPESVEETLQKLEDVYAQKVSSYTLEREKYESVARQNIVEIEEECCRIECLIRQLEQRRANIEQVRMENRMEECLVVACTIDVCLNRLPVSKENYFAHVFLDEAGYSSLIKSATLMAYGDKVTFLGDHMQLPPVCEADNQVIKKEDCQLLALWAQSALFTETIFYESPQKICSDYLNKANMPLCIMKKYNLVNSYRFGEALACVLADDVYDKRFHGNDGHDTQIYYIDAPKRLEKRKRISTAECEAIEEILHNYGGLRRSSGIIAPYKNQVEILRQMAKRIPFPSDSVVTIHQSQGREWDNIFLSVTDTNDKFFTNSLSSVSDGKKVINTAVSRARKNLVIVCDYEYWIMQKSQLIGKLLAVAKKLDVEK